MKSFRMSEAQGNKKKLCAARKMSFFESYLCFPNKTEIFKRLKKIQYCWPFSPPKLKSIILNFDSRNLIFLYNKQKEKILKIIKTKNVFTVCSLSSHFLVFTFLCFAIHLERFLYQQMRSNKIILNFRFKFDPKFKLMSDS